MRTCLLFMATVMVIVSIVAIDTPASEGLRDLLSIRIDSDCRIWWNTGIVRPQNLPQLFPPDSAAENPGEYTLDIPALRNLIREFATRGGQRAVIILPHPASHWVCTDNVMAVVDIVRDEFDNLTARLLKKPVDSLAKHERWRLQYGLNWWTSSDSMILAATHKAIGFVDSVESTELPENSFEFQFKSGRWADRQEEMIEVYLSAQAIPPKIDEPKPVKDEGLLDDSR